jgi:glycosyl-4,4'-diaponeurosporenoate acyltransferase
MILYLSIIGVCVLIISGIVTPIYNVNFFYVLGFAVLAVVLVIIVDALVATVCRLLPQKWASHEKKVYTVSAKEKKFYEKLKIRKWKDAVPELGQFTGFRKNKIVDPKSVEYLDRFLLEICYGELGHTFSLPLGFLILLLFPITKIWLAVAIPVAIVNIFMNLPSLFILRYNSYKLEVLRKSLLKKQQRARKSEALEEAATSEA